MTAVDDYLAQYTGVRRARLDQIYALLRAELPDATVKISYGMPTFWQQQNLIHFAAFQHHIGIYPGAEGISHFAEQLQDWPHSKGALRLPDDRELPLDLVRALAQYRLAQVTGSNG